MSKQSIKAIKEATKNLKELAETKANTNVSFFQLSTIETTDGKLNTEVIRYVDDTNDIIVALRAALNDDPELAHVFGHAIGGLTGKSQEAFQEGLVHEGTQYEMEVITDMAIQRVSNQMTNEEYFKELDNMKKELKALGMPEDDVKEHIKIFDDGVTDAMKAIKESFTED